ncbi:MAG: SAM hydrolase/SAM-dependent halogenase family protein [Candidatus Hodarchaeales archaeon]
MEHERPLIVFLTDFGSDLYTGVMAGKILSINLNAQIVTLSNHVQPQNIKHGAFILKETFTYFPEGAIFLVVVDPGVGSQRKAVAIKYKGYYFVGPDNGIFYPLLEENEEKIIVELECKKKVSNTFHGRDIFAPAAARLSRTKDIMSLGKICSLKNKLTFYLSKDKGEGEVIFIDSFGNIITNLPGSVVKSFDCKYTIYTNDFEKEMEIMRYYSEGPDNEPFILIGSFNTLEIALKNGSASEMLPSITSGTRIKVRPEK